MLVLCATDFSPCSIAAAELAAQLARRFGDELLLLHVVEPFNPPPEAPSGAGLWDRALLDTAEARAAQAAAELRHDGLKVEARVLPGPAAPLVLDLARELRPRFLVLGTHGRRGVVRFFLGSVAEEVARQAPCPVVVTREGAIPAGWYQPAPLRLAVATDGTHAGQAALSWLGGLAHVRECELTAVRLYWPPREAFRYGLEDPWPGPEGTPALTRLLERDVLAELRALCPDNPPRLRLRAATRDAAQELAVEVASLAPDAVVVGVPRRRERGAALSVPAVLRSSPAPVICVPESALPAGQGIPAVRSVLVAVDLSESGPELVRTACGLVRPGGHLELVHVHTPDSPSAPRLGARERLALEAELRGLLPEQAGALGIETTVSVVDGRTPAEAILQSARREDVDLVAVGSHGRSGLNRALLGSVAEAVVREAPVPVLVVGPKRQRAA